MGIADEVNNLKSNEEIDVKIARKKKSKKPRYLTVGTGIPSKEYKNDVVIDAFAVIGNLSPQQLEIFLYLRNLRVAKSLQHYNDKRINMEPNTVILPAFADDPKVKTIKKFLSDNKNGTKMEALRIMKKIKPGKYMINPYLLIPAEDFNDVVQQWERI